MDIRNNSNTPQKRPRSTQFLFDLACTSALSSPGQPTLEQKELEQNMVSPKEFQVRVNDALAALDVGLGLRSTSTRIPIEVELDRVIASLREEQERILILDEISDETSCVSGSGGLGLRPSNLIQDTSQSDNVLVELQQLELFTNTTVISPPLCKRRRER